MTDIRAYRKAPIATFRHQLYYYPPPLPKQQLHSPTSLDLLHLHSNILPVHTKPDHDIYVQCLPVELPPALARPLSPSAPNPESPSPPKPRNRSLSIRLPPLPPRNPPRRPSRHLSPRLNLPSRMSPSLRYGHKRRVRSNSHGLRRTKRRVRSQRVT